MHLLEQATINTLSTWGLPAIRTENPGVWEEEGEKKIAALGVHLRRSITSYGVGLNVSTDLGWFDRIVACGLEGKKVTSMLELGNEKNLWEAYRPSTENSQAWKRWVLGEETDDRYDEQVGPEIELADDGRWKTKTKSAIQWRTRMKPSIVGRLWVKEFAKGLYGESGEDKVVKVDVKDLEDVDDTVIGPLARADWRVRRILPAEEEEALLRTLD